jgi:hypothetical protein
MAPLCYLRHRFPPEIIQHAIWLYLRFTLSYRDADEGVRLLELARNARRPFESQEPREKRRLLNFLVSNCSWKRGELTATHADPLIFWPKRRLRLKRERPPAVSPTALLRFGSPGRTRTSDQAVNSRSLYQLSYRGSKRPTRRTWPSGPDIGAGHIGCPREGMQAAIGDRPRRWCSFDVPCRNGERELEPRRDQPAERRIMPKLDRDHVSSCGRWRGRSRCAGSPRSTNAGRSCLFYRASVKIGRVPSLSS